MRARRPFVIPSVPEDLVSVTASVERQASATTRAGKAGLTSPRPPPRDGSVLLRPDRRLSEVRDRVGEAW